MTKDKSDLPEEKIKKLSEILKEQGLTEIEIETDGLKIKVRKEAVQVAASIPQVQASSPAAASSPAGAAVKDDSYAVKSPMVGTFYASSSPDAAAFVKVGDKVKKGDTLCIVEAMKLMNELPCDVNGEIIEICVANAEAVSFGQVIMKIRKA